MKAFTLIELLIVVAIIAILAAIAVPNFLEAQVRSKISRTHADLRTIATGIEAYRVDHNNYPIDGYKTDGQPFWYPPDGPRLNYAGGLTSPVAYLSSLSYPDPFRTVEDATRARNIDAQSEPGIDLPMEAYRRYRYRNFKYTYGTTATGAPSSAAGQANVGFYEVLYGAWHLMGNGPDKVLTFNTAARNHTVTINGVTRRDCNLIYDPTNGTISIGDVVRSQKHSIQPGPVAPGY